MKKIFSLAVVIGIALGTGAAYADDNALMMTDHRPVPAVAAEGFTSVMPADVTAQASDELPVIGSATPDIGTVLYRDEFGVEAAGSAAGGVQKTSTDTRNTRNEEIWANLLGQSGGSDLP